MRAGFWRTTVILAAGLLMATTVAGQNVVNPGTVSFTCSPDHAAIDSYTLGVFTSSTATTPTWTVTLGKPTPDTTNTCTVAVNFQPLVWGTAYVGRVWAVAGVVSGERSDVSNPFDRSPGKPGGPTIKK